MSMKKKKSQEIHARRRAMQRYGINLSDRRQREMCEMIQSGNSVVVEKQSNRISVHKVDLEGNLLKVVYDKERKQIVTVLPPG